MAKLDENYLNLIRNTLYNVESIDKNKTCPPVKSGKCSKKQFQTDSTTERNKKDIKTKHVTFPDTVKHSFEYDSEMPSDLSFKNRICTPYKSSTTNKTVSITTVKVSPSLSSGSLNSGSDTKEKGKKRRLSVSDTPEVRVKRKKGKAQSIGVKLKFDDGINDIIKPSSLDVKSKKKKKSKRDREIKEKLINGLSALSSKSTSQIQLYSSKSVFSEKNVLKSPDFTENNKISSKRNGIGSKEVAKDFNERNIRVSPTRDFNTAQTDSLDIETSTEDISTSKGVSNRLPFSLAETVNTEELKPAIILKCLKKKKLKKLLSHNGLDIVESKFSIPNVIKITQHPLPVAEDAADFYDNKKVVVKGLKFKRFCNLFPVTQNEQLQRSRETFVVPNKHFRASQSDGFEWRIEALNSTVGIINKVVPEETNHQKCEGNDTEHNTKLEELILSPSTQKINLTEIEISEKLTEEESSLLKSNEDAEELLLEHETYIDKSQIENNDTDEITSPPDILNLKNGNKVIILRQLNQMVHFNGLCCVEILNGEVEILGACLNKHSGEKRLYSPRGTSLLYIRNKCKLLVHNWITLKQLVSEDLLDGSDTNLIFEQHCAILLCKALKEPYIDFIENHISQKILPDSTALEPRVDFDLSGSWNKIQDSEIWEDVLENIPEDSKTIICGGKGVGKSTFLRYAVNMLLKRFKKVRVVDLDPGQSEFHPPGCVVVATVDICILGPNYTHLQAPDRSILTHINIGYNVQQYLKTVQHLLKSIEAMEILPTLVNFPGFSQDLGLDIAANMLKMLQPTLVFEIKSKHYNKNYKMNMTSENINSFVTTSQLLGPQPMLESSSLNYDFVQFNSLSEKNGAWSLEARQAREICILSYFGRMMSEIVRDLTSSDINMFSINISALTIVNPEGKSISPLAINGSLVGLCSAAPNNDSEVFLNHGYGFVRGMDLETDILVLVTPEPIDRLENVSHLVLSSVTTPPALVMSASGVKGHIPFVNVGNLVDLGQFTKRSYLPPKKYI